MKKILAIVLVVVLALGVVAAFVGCDTKGETGKEVPIPEKVVKNIKVGMICLHDKNSTYDKNFIEAMEQVQSDYGMSNDQVIIKTGIPESEECYNAAVELVSANCDIIFADSFGHEDYMIRAAKKYPNVLFAHATGTKAHTENLPNFVNAFASIYEGRYLAGVAAGLKLNEMIKNGKFEAKDAKMGYVGAYPYAEVISGYTSFYLGAKSVCPSVTMDVTFTGSWYNETDENSSAKSLIDKGAKLISQHADSMGAPNACEEAGVPNVSYNGSTVSACPNTFIVSSRINWAPYYKYLIDQRVAGKEVVKDWTGTMTTGSVVLTGLGEKAMAKDSMEKLVEVRDQLLNGTLHVFDCSTFTVQGKTLSSDHKADVDSDPAYTPDTEVVVTKDGKTYFDESAFRSAPYFDVQIDGITLLDKGPQQSN